MTKSDSQFFDKEEFEKGTLPKYFNGMSFHTFDIDFNQYWITMRVFDLTRYQARDLSNFVDISRYLLMYDTNVYKNGGKKVHNMRPSLHEVSVYSI